MVLSVIRYCTLICSEASLCPASCLHCKLTELISFWSLSWKKSFLSSQGGKKSKIYMSHLISLKLFCWIPLSIEMLEHHWKCNRNMHFNDFQSLFILWNQCCPTDTGKVTNAHAYNACHMRNSTLSRHHQYKYAKETGYCSGLKQRTVDWQQIGWS